MSCGRPHDTSCDEVLAMVYEYLDDEIVDHDQRERIHAHLDECGPCLKKYGLEEAVRSLVRRSCAEHAPVDLRVRVLARITEVRATLRVTIVDPGGPLG
ncbi:MAG: mycothiol system anti-sigma-R factor [Actinomycetes bacterium]